MASQRVPVMVIAGFLGSGKTTLLNHLLRNRKGVRIGAVVNDFGGIEVDAMAVAGQVDSMVSLGDGCLCCAVDTEDLDQVLDTLAAPAAGIDLIVIEASGLAEPSTLIRMVLASDDRRIVYGGLVEVVDAAEFDATRTRHPEIERHLRVADLVVLNKTDRVTAERRTALLGELAAISARTPVVCADHGRIDPELFFDLDGPRRGADRDDRAGPGQLTFEDLFREAEEAAHGHHPHTGYQSVDFTADRPLSPRRFMDFLDRRPAGLYRIKGAVHFGADGVGQKWGLHSVGGFLRFHPEPWAPGEQPGTALVLIGSGIDTEAVRAELAACAGPGPEEQGPSSMWCVLRYVDSAEEPEEDDPDPEAALHGTPDGVDLTAPVGGR